MRRSVPLVLTTLLVWCLLAGQVAAQVLVPYRPPVDGAVLRPFEVGDDPYAAGDHRGVDLAAPAGTPVVAAAGGEVTSAGSVGVDVWVTVAHPDGIATTYGSLDDLAVGVGDPVDAGQVLGHAAGRHQSSPTAAPSPGLHWGARRGETYLDPLTLLDQVAVVPTLVGPGGWVGSHPVLEPYAPRDDGSHHVVFAPPSPTAGRQGFPLPPNEHRILMLPGYGTEGPHGPMVGEWLGFASEDVHLFSYTGCVPSPDGCDPAPYGGDDTNIPVERAAALLDEQLRALGAADRFRPVDLLGHSMGADVAAYYLEHVYDPTDPALPPVANLVSVASPHGGSGTAGLANAVGDNYKLGYAAEGLRRLAVAGGNEAADRVGFGSAPLERYGGPFGTGGPRRDPVRLEDLGIEVLSIAGDVDLVVGRRDTRLGTGTRRTLGGGHSEVLTTEAAYRDVHEFLAGDELPDSPFRIGAVSDVVTAGAETAGHAMRGAGVVGDAIDLVTGGRGRIVRVSIESVVPGPNDALAQPPGRAARPRDTPATGMRGAAERLVEEREREAARDGAGSASGGGPGGR